MRTDTALRPIQRILVGGPPAGGPGAAEVGIRLAKLLDARLRVVHVQSPHSLLERLGLDSEPVPKRAALTDADVLHLAQREGLRPASYETDTLRGQPRHVLIDEVERWQADLMVVGANERHQPGVRLGTVAEHLIRNARCPVLVVNGRRPIPPQRILFPVDLSEFALYSLACGLNFLDQIDPAKDNEELVLETLLVIPPNGESAKERQRAGLEGLDSWLEGGAFDAALGQTTVEGFPARAIVDEALGGDFDLVVMGTHGHGSHGLPLGGIGSVTGEVLDRAPSHMLIVPPKAEFGAELAEAVVSQTEPRFTPRRSQ